jgi:hypothetical protein
MGTLKSSKLTNITLNVVVEAKQTSMAKVVVHDVSLCGDFLILRRTVSCLQSTTYVHFSENITLHQRLGQITRRIYYI